MNRRFCRIILLFVFAALLPFRAPAPLTYVPGEGWFYETFGEKSKWQRTRAKDQLDVAEQAFKDGNYKIAMHAAQRVLHVWPLSDYAPRAEYLLARCQEARRRDEAAFKAYQVLLQKYPRTDSYEDVLWREYAIANRFLDGEWFRLWNTIPLYSSMDETAKLFDKLVNNGPYSDVAPHAQLRIGAAHEKAKEFDEAAKAYETAADRYNNQPLIASDALYREGLSYQKEAATAEYDQSTAGKAIAVYTDFITFYPDDKRVPQAEKSITAMKKEQVRGNYMIAKYYEKTHRWAGAVVYYNEVLQLDPNSPLAAEARTRIEVLKPRLPAVVN
jgi:outer membrane protein assembly factor BamD